MGLTAQEMVDRVLDQADMKMDRTAQEIDDMLIEREGFVSTPEALSLLNLELSELYDLIVTAWEDYAIRHPAPTITTVEGQDHYLLPEGLYKLRRIYELSGTTRRPVGRFPPHRLHIGSSPSGGRILEVHFVPEFKPLVDLSETLNWSFDYSLPWGWEDFAISGAVARCLEKEESDPGPALMRKAAARQRIIAAAPGRDESEPERIINVEKDLEWMEDENDMSGLSCCIFGRYLYVREED